MDKFPMKLVIDAVTTPLLHAKLSEARSPRERAALLRSIAEAALRLQQGGVQVSTETAPADLVLRDAKDVATVPNESGSDASFNSADIADQLASFL
jgi:hypothetical protein